MRRITCNLKFLTEILAVSPIFYGFYIIIPQINYILFRSHIMDDLLEAVIIVITILAGQFRGIVVFVYRRKIARLFTVCKVLWDHANLEDYKVISIWTRRARLFSTTYFCTSQFAITAFIMTSTVKQPSSPANSTTRYYPFHYQEDLTPSPQYEIKYTIQVIIGYLGNTFILAADMAGTLLALNMCGQLALVRSWLLDISKEEIITERETSGGSLRVRLKKCICRHQIVMDFCTELEEVVCYINLAQIIAEMYIMAISGARLMKSIKATRYLASVLSSTSGLFFLCWPADNLSFSSDEIAQAIYGVPWCSSSSDGKTMVAIMLTRSQRSVKLTAGKFVTLSLETFSSIVSSGVSFCMVLNSF